MQYSVLEPWKSFRIVWWTRPQCHRISLCSGVEMGLTVSILLHTDSSYNGGHKTLKFYKVLLPVWFATQKQNLMPSIKSFIYSYPYKLSNHSGPLGYWKILGKSQNWVETYPRAPSQKIIVRKYIKQISEFSGFV